jgi:uncharacterized membrane protein YozB (DUF420 family)
MWMVAPLLSQGNLVLQISIVVILLVGLALNRRRKYFWHGIAMLVALVLNLGAFLLVMGPSLLALEPSIVISPLNRISIVAIVHGTLGGVTEILGIWIVGSWHGRRSTQSCARKKWIMRVTWVMWLIALVLGMLLYALLYTTLFK